MKHLIYLCLLLCLPFASSIAEEYCRPELTILVDTDLTARAGAETLYGVFQGYEVLDRQWYRLPLLSGSGKLNHTARFVKLIAWDLPIVNLFLVTQHEIFGHGARLREFDIKQSYSFNAPFPYGTGGAATSFSGNAFMNLKPLEQSAVTTGGVEASELFARRIARSAFAKECITLPQILLYFFTQHDLTNYTYTLTRELVDKSGHDINDYIIIVNDYCGRSALSRSRLQRFVWINYIDPITWCFAGCFWTPPCEGIPLSFFNIYGFKILPSVRMTLAPYGPEYGVNAFFKFCNYQGFAYYRQGNTCNVTTFGTGVEINQIWTYKQFCFGLRTDFWKQPPIFSSSSTSKTHLGGAISLLGEYQIDEQRALLIELGAKSRGFIPGDRLDGGVIFRLGMRL